MPTEFETAVNRLDLFEAQLRRQRRYVMGLTTLVLGQGVLLLYLLLPVGRLFGGAPKVIEASRFVLVDDRGQVRGELKMDNGPVLVLLSASGQERAALDVNHNAAAGLTLMDNGAGRAVLVYASDEGAAVEFHDRRGGRSGFIQTDEQAGFRRFDNPAPPPAGPKP